MYSRIEYQDKALKIENDAVEAGRGDPAKTIKAISDLLEKLGERKKLEDEVEDHGRKSPGPNQMTWNVDRLDVHACSLKHLESRIKRLQEVLGTGYELAVKVAGSLLGYAEESSGLQGNTRQSCSVYSRTK